MGDDEAKGLVIQAKAMPPGTVVAGKYRIDRVLGTGGMGVVAAATHMQLEQRVALKFLLPHFVDNPEIVARFTREARAAAKIQSEHVARVLDVGTSADGTPFIVMEYLEGRDLAAELKRRGRLSLREAVHYVLEASEAIAEAHTHGIVHRDLKPPNLFLARRADHSATVKVLDFGISKAMTAKDADLTRTAALIGSPYYMSPEQLTSSRDVDPRTDIWSLGIILYELLSGSPPFRAETMPEIIAKILGTEPEPLQAFRDDLPPKFDDVVRRALAKKATDRYPNIAEFAAAVARFGGSHAAESSMRIARILGTPETVERPIKDEPRESPGRGPGLGGTDTTWSDALVVPKTRTLPLIAAVATLACFLGLLSFALRSRTTVETAAAQESPSRRTSLGMEPKGLAMDGASPAPSSNPSTSAKGAGVANAKPVEAAGDAGASAVAVEPRSTPRRGARQGPVAPDPEGPGFPEGDRNERDLGEGTSGTSAAPMAPPEAPTPEAPTAEPERPTQDDPRPAKNPIPLDIQE